ncbi:MAG: exosortase/archaeosortase family protein [Chloroflexi bacterium]|nr:exosortase/archaeosortase family protein [Chloroflexota bacterium]
MAGRIEQLKNWFGTKVVVRIGLWLAVSLVLSLVFFKEFWAKLGTMLSPEWIFEQHHAAGWGILALCAIWLYLKRKEISRNMSLGLQPVFIPLGLALIVGAILMPTTQNYLVFQVLLAALGVFIIIFGKAAKIPAILLGIYGFGISFPLLIERFAELPYSVGSLKPLMWIMTGLGYPFQSDGVWVNFTSLGGEPVSVAIISACGGPVTMGVFLSIFALMMLDVPLPPKKAAWLFLFGVAGTWFQAILRLVILMFVGYYWGRDALFSVHSWSIYVVFPLWYLLFVYVYFRQVKKPPEAGGRGELKYLLAGGR